MLPMDIGCDMGYFSNGTEGESYEARWCDNCIHQNGPDGESSCAVWLAHLLYSYDECNNPESILHLLIPREGIDNQKCTMFWHKSEVSVVLPETKP